MSVPTTTPQDRQYVDDRAQERIPDAELWRFEARPTRLPRYEEQDLPLLLHDLRRTPT